MVLSWALSRSEMTAVPSGRKTIDQGIERLASIRATSCGAAAAGPEAGGPGAGGAEVPGEPEAVPPVVAAALPVPDGAAGMPARPAAAAGSAAPVVLAGGGHAAAGSRL